MITNKGKNIVAKYLIGQAPSYASYLAFGSGPKPLGPADSFADYSSKESLDFEMFRAPITSRGYVTEDGISKVVFTAELPTEERYEISEIGVYSAGSNPSSNANDSKTVLSFATSENWEHHTAVEAKEIPILAEPLHPGPGNVISVTQKAFQAAATNPTFSNDLRVARYERPRFLNNGVFISGDISNLTRFARILSADGDGSKIVYTTDSPHTLVAGQGVVISEMLPVELNLSGIVSEILSPTSFSVSEDITAVSTQAGKVSTQRLVVNSESEHIHLAGISVNFNKNAPTDELKVAFSVISKDASSTTSPDRVSLVIEFATVDSAVDGERSIFEIDLENGLGSQEDGEHDFTNNRYVTVKRQLQELFKTGGFNWGDIQIVKVFATVFEDDEPSSNFYVCLDALRLENVTTQSPLYGLTGYSVVKTLTSQPIIKDLNTSNLAEFRFALEVE
jgi:hypothetical protein